MKRETPLIPTHLPMAPDSDDAGFGALKTAAGLLPLKALAIEARIVGLVAETSLRQTFVNACPEPLEAVYIFPLPPSAAVTQFTMTAQGRRVDGTLMERTAAHAAYREALRAGHRAALLPRAPSPATWQRQAARPPRSRATSPAGEHHARLVAERCSDC
jgi:hypothetical protein